MVTRSVNGHRPQELLVRIDGRDPMSADTVAHLAAVCDQAEDGVGAVRVVAHVSGGPAGAPPPDVTVAIVNRWERVVRRFERLPAATIAVAEGDCGATALDVLLAADHRIATPTARLMLPVYSGATWPGMAVYRLARYGAHASAIRRAVLFGDPITASEALELRVIDTVTDDVTGALVDASRLTEGRVGAELAIRRQLLADAPAYGFDEALGAHLAACDRSLRRAETDRLS
jgi:isomerase DpgB